MFRRNLKLLAMMVGLVAVLVMELAVPGVTQRYPAAGQPTPTLSRQNIVGSLQNLFSTLTASEGDVFDIQGAVFYSHPEVTIGFAILDRASKSWALMEDLLAGQPVTPTIGGIYVVEDSTGFLKPGRYIVKAINQNQVALFDMDENQIALGKLQIKRLPQLVGNPSIKEVQLRHASPWCARGSFKGFGVEISIEIGTTCAT